MGWDTVNESPLELYPCHFCLIRLPILPSPSSSALLLQSGYKERVLPKSYSQN